MSAYMSDYINNLVFDDGDINVLLIDSDEFYIKKTKNGFLTQLKSGISSCLFFLKRQFHESFQI